MARPATRDAMYRGRAFDAETIEFCVRWYITYRGLPAPAGSRRHRRASLLQKCPDDQSHPVAEESDPGRLCAESLRGAAPAAGESKVEIRGGPLQQVPQQHR